MWKKIVAPALLVTAFWCLSSMATSFYIRRLEALPSKMILEDLGTIHEADAMRYTMGRTNRTMATSPRPIPPEIAMQIKGLLGEFEQHLGGAFATANSPEELEIDGVIQQRFAVYRQEVLRQIEERNPQNLDANADLRKLFLLSFDVGQKEVQLGEVNETSMREHAANGSPSMIWLERLRYALLIVGPVAGIVCGFWMSRRFHRSVSQISVTLNDVASEMRQHVGRIDVKESAELPGLHEQVSVIVTRIRDVMQKLDEARQQAIKTSRLASLGEMAAGVAHELRNPLTSVKLLIQASGQRPDHSLTDKQFSVVLEEISRMEITIERMLDFARPARINLARQDLREAVQRALTSVEARAQHANVTIACELPQTPVEVDADRELLHTVFSNLLQNGIEAMNSGGTLRVKVEGGLEKGRCQVAFTDHGPGIAPEVMARIFEPFTTNKARGTGLGLAVSYRIVRDHHGELTAANGTGGGAIFVVELPQVSPDNDTMSQSRNIPGGSAFTTGRAHAQAARY